MFEEIFNYPYYPERRVPLLIDTGRQWADRLRIWSEQFDKHLTRKLCALETEYFTTFDHLSLCDAEARGFMPAPIGMRWGKKWEYGWFRTRFTVPESAAGERLVLTLRTAPEMLVFVNGEPAGSLDKQHHAITLTRAAVPEECFTIYAECYAGHGAPAEGAGPVGVDEIAVPEPHEPQVTTGESAVYVWNEPLYQAAMDYRTLYSLLKRLPDKSLRAAKVLAGLKKFTYIADFELPEPQLTESVVRAAKVLAPLLQCKNGDTAPEFTVFGQSHIDLAWLWPVEETERKAARTYANQLALMDEYPEYAFLLCEPPIPEYLRRFYPSLFVRVCERARQGRFYADGAMYVESDTNIPSGESLIRQFVLGKRWFRDELGADSRLAWMPDTFGFSAQLPQIMRKCGVPYFATQKLLRQDPEAEPFPYNLFWWEGLDGSRVLAHVFKKNNAELTPEALIARWEDDRIQVENIDGMLFPYGYGDGGGGPTRDMVEFARRCRDLEGAPRCRLEPPEKFFDRAEDVQNTFVGELYLAWHRGTLTAQSETKHLIREAEVALKNAQYCLVRQRLAGLPEPPGAKRTLDELERALLQQQFHDVAAGAGIARVHAHAVEELKRVIDTAGELCRAMLGEPDGVMPQVYNTLAWDRTFCCTRIPAQGSAIVDMDFADIPNLPNWDVAVTEDADGFTLKNKYLVCRIDRTGRLVSLRRARDNREYMAAPGNVLHMYRDVNTCYDAWEIGSMYEQVPTALGETAELPTIKCWNAADGEAIIEFTRRVHHSELRQMITLSWDSERLEFHTDIDWHERHQMLKVSFPFAVHATAAAHEIQYGYLLRPTHASRQSDRDQYEVCNHRYTAVYDASGGAAVLNDGKYGVSVHGADIALTLLRAPMKPDETADIGKHSFTYAVYPFARAFADSAVTRQAIELNEPILYGSRGIENTEPIFLPDAPNIIVDTIRPSDLAPNAAVVRLYESAGKRTVTDARVHSRVISMEETDMLEENGKALSLPMTFTPFEIKTIVLSWQK